LAVPTTIQDEGPDILSPEKRDLSRNKMISIKRKQLWAGKCKTINP